MKEKWMTANNIVCVYNNYCYSMSINLLFSLHFANISIPNIFSLVCPNFDRVHPSNDDNRIGDKIRNQSESKNNLNCHI